MSSLKRNHSDLRLLLCMQAFSVIFLHIVVSSAVIAQIPNPYLFLEWKSEEDKTLYVGNLTYDEEYKVDIEYNKKTYKHDGDSAQKHLRKVREHLNDLKPEKCDLLFYIHGFGAHRSYFTKLNNSAIQKDISDNDGSTIGIQITYSWNVGFNYLAGIPKAIDLGYYYAGFMAQTIRIAKQRNPDTKVYLITHSMGNRVFLGVFNRLREEFDIPIIDEHIMAAPDIEPTIFEKGEPLAEIGEVVKGISVYRHNTDRVLTVSGQLADSKRIGLTGLSYDQLDAISHMVKVVDCSLLNDNERFDFGNHNYYYQSPTVRRDIYNVLMNQEEALQTTRKPLKHAQRFVLQFPAKDKKEAASN